MVHVPLALISKQIRTSDIVVCTVVPRVDNQGLSCTWLPSQNVPGLPVHIVLQINVPKYARGARY